MVVTPRMLATMTAAAFLLAGSGAWAGAEIRKVIAIDGTPPDVVVPAIGNPTLLTPSTCRSVTYQAGPGEFAVVSVAVTATPSDPSDSTLYLAVTRSTPFQPFTSVSAFAQSESLGDGTALVSARATVPLDEGQTYQFGTGVKATGQTDMSVFSCQGTVVIHAEEP